MIESGNAILETAIALGGTVSGEHGIGYEKREAMTQVYSTDDLATMARVRDVFDPSAAQSGENFSERRSLPRGAPMTAQEIAKALAASNREGKPSR